jgi:predicted DsbA family dithiol-disulfide isomerase
VKHPSRIDATSFYRIAIWIGILGCLGTPLGCANGGDGASDDSASNQAPIARVDDEPIALSDVDRRIKDELFAEKFPAGKGDAGLYEARRATINEIVDEKLLAQHSAESNMSEEEWLAARVAELPEITEVDVETFYAENQSRFAPGTTLEVLAGPIREHLGQMKEAGIRERLREESTVVISLPRERKTVATTGHSLGPESAPVTIVEFSDFQCPYCSRVVPTVKEIAARYPDQVRIVFRHLPLNFHANARNAAYGSICAGDQDRFWEYHDLLFANQRALQRAHLSDYATSLGLDMESFETCMSAPETEAQVAADLEEAERLGASGTPAFFINGIFLSGSQPIEVFDELIQEEIAGSEG